MKARPILFSAEMVRALLAGRKTQTRRTMKEQPPDWITECGYTAFTPRGSISGRGTYGQDGPAEKFFRCPFGVAGDQLWVRETWVVGRGYDGLPGSKVPPDGYVRRWYAADGPKPDWAGRTRSARFMPRWASRITLELTGVRAQRLQGIDEADARAEGMNYDPGARAAEARYRFSRLWEAINGEDSWAANLWVWALTFRVLETRNLGTGPKRADDQPRNGTAEEIGEPGGVQGEARGGGE